MISSSQCMLLAYICFTIAAGLFVYSIHLKIEETAVNQEVRSK